MGKNKEFSLERTLKVTASLLARRTPKSISIAEIAREARCSTSTIYEAYTSKEQLFLEALSYGNRLWDPPLVDTDADDSQAFLLLLDYLERRIGYLSSERLRGLFTATIVQGERTRPMGKRMERDFDQRGALAILIEASMRNGELKPGDPRTTAYCLSASVSFEPFMRNVTQGEQVDPHRALRFSLDPFVTDYGRKVFEAQIAGALQA
jgi:AcrR family transcriptional regulator